MFVSADYEHNTNVHDILVHDLNLVGAARTLDVAAAQTAITTTNSSFGCATVSCAIAAGATITDYAANGLGSPVSGLAEQFAAPNGGFAFPGLNPNFGQMGTITTTGRSNYNAFQFRVRQDKRQPVAGVDSLNWQVSYNLSRFLAMSPDQDASLVNVADNANPTEFYGPTNLDRTHMISAAGTATLRGGLLLSWIARINTRLPATLTQPYACDCPAEIFLTDITGDGSGGDILPGTNIGSYGRSISPGQLNPTISQLQCQHGRDADPGRASLGERQSDDGK